MTETKRDLLEGLKVLDITIAGMGPLSIGYLANHGATVILIESKTHPNNNRVSFPYRGGIPNLNTSGMMTPFYTSRYSLGLNLRTPEGREIAKRLALWADIVCSRRLLKNPCLEQIHGEDRGRIAGKEYRRRIGDAYQDACCLFNSSSFSVWSRYRAQFSYGAELWRVYGLVATG